MKIAICDDDQRARKDLCQILLSDEVKSLYTSIDEFSSGRELIDSYKDQRFGLIFLDIEMPGLSGLETGLKIREMDQDVIIVFLTNHKEYVHAAYPVETFDYLMKPVEADKIRDLLVRVSAKYLTLHHLVYLPSKENVALEVKEIIYIESYRRHITFHTENGEFKYVGKLDEYESKLSLCGFLRCHQGFLVNMHYIRSIGERTITTTTGDSIAMSARRRQHCLQAFQKHIERYTL
jgi:DNA-binding LytR/AlgR family response regulator